MNLLKKISLWIICIFLPLYANASAAEKSSLHNGVSDYDAVHKLVVSERIYRVTHRNAELAECYSDDAQIHTSWQSGGKDSFVGKTTVESAEALPIVNRCNPPLINLKGNKALVEYPMTTTREVRVNKELAVLTSYMVLIYRIEKRNDVWKIIDMYTINEYDTLSPVIPGTDLHIDYEQIKNYRPSYRWLTYVRKLAGGNISDDLVGTDQPDAVNKIYDSGNKWLNNH
ncbi:nuclear transport factor 2 family protein [Succinivibrio dextrinosolvens]|uniref:nuclear transport factor 2 family protein n=1 Tax=Succinivibrio dextrinosolvens TaxID=83771 RepID=UPI00241E3766|nr:nuclear transport factor 2 family protein [Succinivibrio dextrinosolvens]MBE6422444.1 hypothetical protein [Succinivibrio dextrinosolvens]